MKKERIDYKVQNIPEVWNGNIRIDMTYGPFVIGQLMWFIQESLKESPKLKVRVCPKEKGN